MLPAAGDTSRALPRSLGRTFIMCVELRTMPCEATSEGRKQMIAQTTEHKHGNRLIDETSPYLLQHADNPVDWYPWGDEAFAAARKLDRPIFLSIGYSTCHWCHVMAHESFMNAAIADILNEHFISIKVDREQRPDIDAVYMNAVQAMTGSGGWPLSVFLTPDGKPFYGGTYFPPTDRWGRPGFDRVLLAIVDAWNDRRAELIESAGRMTQALADLDRPQAGPALSTDVIRQAEQSFEQAFDNVNGGFGTEPKFPQCGILSFLMTRWARTQNSGLLDMVTATLDAMAAGGIRDHLGGGFHRYTVDAHWLTPHFEKMLYDQALLTRGYLEAFQITGRPDYAQVARDIMNYVLRDMSDPAGGFYSAEDADSEGREGTFYLWTPDEITRLLPPEQAALFMDYCGVTEEGNFEDGKTILSVRMSLDELARRHNRNAAEAADLLQAARTSLFDARSRRPRPHRDEKIITGWNGLMIRSLAMAGRILNDETYTHAARRSAEFILSALRIDGRLYRFFAKGRPVGLAFLEDHAFMIQALIDLYEADWNPHHLADARKLADAMAGLFADEHGGAFYQTGRDAEALILQTKPSYDGPIPSGNSAAAEALLRLSQITTDKRFSDHAEKTLEAFSGRLAEAPTSLPDMLIALDWFLGPCRQIVIAGHPDADDTRRMFALIGRAFMPAAIRLLHPEGPIAAEIEKLAPWTAQQKPVGGKSTAYICEDRVCRRPIDSLEGLKKALSTVE